MYRFYMKHIKHCSAKIVNMPANKINKKDDTANNIATFINKKNTSLALISFKFITFLFG